MPPERQGKREGTSRTPGPRPLAEQLQRLYSRLKRTHPELLAVGLGHRQRAGEAVLETTVKLVVTRKYRRLPKQVTPLPPEVPLTVLALGQPVTVNVPTDVVQVERAAPTSLPVDGMVATGLAAWQDGAGTRCLGVITASHGVTKGAQVPVAVRSAPGQAPGVVVAASDLDATGLDIALVQVAVPPAALFDVSTQSFPVMPPVQALAALSGSDSDNLVVQMTTWGTSPPAPIRGLAYFGRYPLKHADGSFRYLREVVYATSSARCFSPGTSGGAWVTTGYQPGECVVAIQSHAVGSRGAVANLLQCALDWLSRQPGINGLRVAWRVADL